MAKKDIGKFHGKELISQKSRIILPMSKIRIRFALIKLIRDISQLYILNQENKFVKTRLPNAWFLTDRNSRKILNKTENEVTVDGRWIIYLPHPSFGFARTQMRMTLVSTIAWVMTVSSVFVWHARSHCL